MPTVAHPIASISHFDDLSLLLIAFLQNLPKTEVFERRECRDIPAYSAVLEAPWPKSSQSSAAIPGQKFLIS